MFAPSRDLAAIIVKDADGTNETMLRVFFTIRRLIVLETLPKGTTFLQHYFIWDILPDLYEEKLSRPRKKLGQDFLLHMDNSKCQHPKKIMGKLQKKHISRTLHPPSSPYLSPYDFWFFGMVKQKIKDREFCSLPEILRSLSDASSDLTFE
jgi:hypothetical protein